jgi:diguanylate cyclase (GGDEF)-like protein
MRILIADPNDGRRLDLAELLRARGLRVIEAVGGADALELARNSSISIAIIAAGTDAAATLAGLGHLPAIPIRLISITAPSDLDDLDPDHLFAVLDATDPPARQVITLDAALCAAGERQRLAALHDGIAEIRRNARHLRTLVQEPEASPLYEAALHSLCRLIGSDSGIVVTANSGPFLRRGVPHGMAVQVGIGRFSNLTEADTLPDHLEEVAGAALTSNEPCDYPDHGLICVPLPPVFGHGGCVILQRSDNTTAFSILAPLLTHLVVRAAETQKLFHMATRDGLTGLYDQAFGQRAVNRELRRCNRWGSGLSLAMIDIDHFKEINDRHGHVAGDHCLVAVGEVLSGLLRGTDLTYRSGGEEFVALLPGCPPEHAEMLGFRFVDRMRQLDVRFDGLPIPLTASVGIVSLPSDGLSGFFAGKKTWDSLTERMLQLADAAMYQAKELGRDRVHLGGRLSDITHDPRWAAIVAAAKEKK